MDRYKRVPDVLNRVKCQSGRSLIMSTKRLEDYQ